MALHNPLQRDLVATRDGSASHTVGTKRQGPLGRTEILLYRRPNTTELFSSAAVSAATRFSLVARLIAFSTCTCPSSTTTYIRTVSSLHLRLWSASF